jgi:hypothetical protein
MQAAKDFRFSDVEKLSHGGFINLIHAFADTMRHEADNAGLHRIAFLLNEVKAEIDLEIEVRASLASQRDVSLRLMRD